MSRTLEFTAKQAGHAAPPPEIFSMVPSAGTTVSRNKPKEPVQVVFYDNAGAPGRFAEVVPGDPTLVNKKGKKVNDFIVPVPEMPAVPTVAPPQDEPPIVEYRPTSIPVEPISVAKETSVTKEESKTGNGSLISVTFERESGDSFTVQYHDMIFDGTYLTFVFDHHKSGVLYRPGVSEEPIYVMVDKLEGKQSLYKCYTTGYRLKYRNLEFIAFTVDEVKTTED